MHAEYVHALQVSLETLEPQEALAPQVRISGAALSGSLAVFLRLLKQCSQGVPWDAVWLSDPIL